MSTYLATVYDRGAVHDLTVEADSAEAAVNLALRRFPLGRPATTMCRRWQKSPDAADRDNVHRQHDPAGRAGIFVRRAEVDPGAAQHRNDVAVAREWVAAGRTLAELQRYGGYLSVTDADVAG